MKNILFKHWLIKGMANGVKTEFRQPIPDELVNIFFNTPDLDYADTNKMVEILSPYITYKIGNKYKLVESYFIMPDGSFEYRTDDRVNPKEFKKGWKVPYSIPKERIRYFIEITGVYIQKMDDMTDGDAIREGFRDKTHLFEWWLEKYGLNSLFGTYVFVYQFDFIKGRLSDDGQEIIRNKNNII